MTYRERLEQQPKDLVAMIHVDALPGTPANENRPAAIVSKAVEEATCYQRHGIATVLIENMHDLPYTKSVGPEVVATMAVIGRAVKDLGLNCGIQILAGCNREAIAVAHAANLDFVRVEGFVFSHVGDEGLFDSCAGELLRYRKMIGAEEVLVFTDIKKKHSSHALTADLSLVETAEAAQFFRSDGIIITGTSTGQAVDVEELRSLRQLPIRRLVGSGVTPDNLPALFPVADIFIVGSYLKQEGHWSLPPDPERVAAMVAAFTELCQSASAPS